MTYDSFKKTLLSKSIARVSLPEDENLKERIFAGMKMIAKETIPLRLVVKNPLGNTILRRVDEETYIRMPEIPREDESEIDIDSALIDALAYYVIAGLERGNANTHMGMYHGEIDMNNDRLTETYLSDSSNDSVKFEQFP